jgi:hypothetical protein
MADLTFSCAYTLNKPPLQNRVSVNGATATMSLAGLKTLTITLTSNAQAISTVDLAAVGVAYFQNISTHTAATVSLRANGQSFGGPLAGEPAIMRLVAGVDYTAIGTPGGRLRVDIMEN